MKVSELVPGMTFRDPRSLATAVFITSSPHPTYPGLRLVVWRMSPAGEFPDGLSFDALHFHQDVGEPIDGTPTGWLASLRAALVGPGPGDCVR